MIWPGYEHYIKDQKLNDHYVERCENFDDLKVPEKYRIIWKDVSFLVQLNKARNHNLSEEDTKRCFTQLIKRPYYLASIAKSFDAKNIVEVGTAEGLQFYSFAEYASNSAAHVWSCDIIDKRNNKYAQLYNDNTTFCLGTSKEMACSIEEKIDLFYIDASHQQGAVLKYVNPSEASKYIVLATQQVGTQIIKQLYLGGLNEPNYIFSHKQGPLRWFI